MQIALIAFLALGICALAMKIVIAEYDHARERLTDSVVIVVGLSALVFMLAA
jgi:hypothetical protein